ncbi:50S ribosomal protein L10 [Tuwongella immobilis]|uniref:Large ribosomal subunit protein uL10 n=1 Tax=Tuwongella immobilis TaxID=692036 RepID=A0A6C2YLP6_9BACT|nr:50S ribosomal protein L10 [Tuwongella immobilis]VIP02498.1 50s ribosomal protein l10 : Probable 50S ribosomal protein L10 OS=Planctomyces maris DSM 8797 GN=PM8797T_12141 PE=3 SV=1: Ribosomal_L10 [Tuwongella immobilis]VTS01581.1 50s ribosomal protein l10 : Probable 50S ribosomal protein L10 OS=Planctomyces maris DSM 8797 GN=PM8797T_12141 PE=3 SV=1: Ribosomal_L10 [Tuwongella immobilis]
MSKKVKQMELDALTKTFAGVRELVLIAPNKVDSALDYTMRKTLREKKIRVQMVKNTLARKVLGGFGVTAGDNWSGPTLIAWGTESIKELSTAVDAFIKDTVKKNPKAADKLKVKTAVVDGQPVKLEDAMKMPTRLEAIGEIVNAILAPASAIAGALTGPISQVASQIQTLSEKTEGDEATAPAESAS